MSEPKYTDEQFIAAIRKAVEIRGEDYVYPSKKERPEYWTRSRLLPETEPVCRYQLDDSTPACIVGVALHLIDPELVPDSRTTHGADYILRALGFSRAVVYGASNAQTAQDNNETWGEALMEFESGYVLSKSRENRL